jgi:trigger factor
MVMASEPRSVLKELSPIERELSIVIPSDWFKKETDSAYVRLSQRVNLKGFRPGKAPRNVLEQYYKPEVERDVLERLINRSFVQATTEHKLAPISEPNIDAPAPYKAGQDFNYTVRIEIKPTIELATWRGLELKAHTYDVNDAAVQLELTRLQEELSTRELESSRTQIAQGDFVECDVKCMVGGQEVKELASPAMTLEIGSGRFFVECEQALVGKALGETVHCDVTLPATFAIERLREQVAHVTMTPKNIKILKKPALDDEFAKDVSDEFSTLADLKAAIERDLQTEKIAREAEEKSDVAISKLLEDNTFDVPNAMVNKQAEYLAMRMLSKIPEEQAKPIWAKMGERLKENAKPEALKSVKAALLLEKLADDLNIEISESDLDQEFQQQAEQAGVSKNELRKHYDNNDVERMRARLRNERALKAVVDAAHYTFESKSIR